MTSSCETHSDVITWKYFRIPGPLCVEIIGKRWKNFLSHRARNLDLYWFHCHLPHNAFKNQVFDYLRRLKYRSYDVTVLFYHFGREVVVMFINSMRPSDIGSGSDLLRYDCKPLSEPMLADYDINSLWHSPEEKQTPSLHLKYKHGCLTSSWE